MKILLVEDDQTLVESLVQIMKEKKRQVDEVRATIQETQTWLQRPRVSPWVAILDLHLEDGDADELLDEFRTQRVPVLVITGDDRWELGAHCLQNGAHDFLRKPFNIDELLVRLERLIASAPAPVVEIGGVMVNLQTGELIGIEDHLTTNQLNLLRACVEQRGRVVSWQDLERAVWGDHQRAVGAINKLLRRLRIKVDPGGDQLETHFNQGVCLAQKEKKKRETQSSPAMTPSTK